MSHVGADPTPTTIISPTGVLVMEEIEDYEFEFEFERGQRVLENVVTVQPINGEVGEAFSLDYVRGRLDGGKIP